MSDLYVDELPPCEAYGCEGEVVVQAMYEKPVFWCKQHMKEIVHNLRQNYGEQYVPQLNNVIAGTQPKKTKAE